MNTGSGRKPFNEILDQNFFQNMNQYFTEYFAKCHTSSSIPYLLGNLGFLVWLIQTIGFFLLISSDEIWKDSNVISKLVKTVSFIWQGTFMSNHDARNRLGFVIWVCIFLIVGIISARVIHFHQKKLLYQNEACLILIITGPVFNALFPIAISCLPNSILLCINGNYSLLVISNVVMLPSMLTLVVILNFYYISPRILLDSHLNQGWFSRSNTMEIVFISLQSFFSISISLMDGIYRYILITIMILLSLIMGLEPLYNTPKIIGTISDTLSSICFTSSILGVMQLMGFLSMPINCVFIFFSVPVSIIFIYFILSTKRKKRISKTLEFFDECIVNTHESAFLIHKKYQNEKTLTLCICESLEFWHPFILSLIPFESAIQKWPSSQKLYILYGRVVSCIPEHSNKLSWISNQIGKYELNSTYIEQIQVILNLRERSLTQEIAKIEKTLSIKTNSLVLKLIQFWDSVLRKDISSTWVDYLDLNERIETLKNAFEHLIYNYPVNLHICKLYYTFVQNYIIDPFLQNSLKERAEKIVNNDIMGNNETVDRALMLFPFYAGVLKEFNSSDNQSIRFQNDELDWETQDNDSLAVVAINEAISDSPIGSICLPEYSLVIMTILLFLLISFVFTNLRNTILIPHQSLCNSIHSLNKLGKDFGKLVLLISFGSIQNNIEYKDAIIESNILPSLSKNNLVHEVFVNSTLFNTNNMIAQDSFSKMTADISSFEIYFPNTTTLLNQLLFNDTAQSSSLKEIFNLEILRMTNLVQTKNFSEIDEGVTIPKMIESFENINSIIDKASTIILKNQFNQNSNYFKDFRDSAIWIILLILFLIELPYVLTAYRIGLEKSAIVNSLIGFPGEEIRNILNNLGKRMIKEEQNSIGLYKISNSLTIFGSTINKKLLYSLFIPASVLLLVSIFRIQSFLGDSNLIPESIYYLSKPQLFFKLINLYCTRIISSNFINNSNNLNYTNDLVQKSLSKVGLSLNLLKKGYKTNSPIMEEYLGNPSRVSNDMVSVIKDSFNSSKYERLLCLDYMDMIEQILISYYSLFSHDTALGENKTIGIIEGIVFSLNEVVDSIENDFLEKIMYSSNSTSSRIDNELFIVLVVLLIWQGSLSVLTLFQYLKQKKLLLKALTLYKFLPPLSISKNPQAIKTIVNGSLEINSIISFPKSNTILDKLDCIVVITTTKLDIVGFNKRFYDYFSNIESPMEKKITNLFEKSNNITEYFSKINNRILINDLKHEKEILKLFLKDTNHELQFELESLFLSDIGPIDFEYSTRPVKHVAFLMEDVTKNKVFFDKLAKEQKRLINLLKNAVPLPIITGIIEGKDSTCFQVPAISVAAIRVAIPESNCIENDIKNLNNVFDMICQNIDEENDIWKIRTFSRTITIASGLFGRNLKIERAAAELTKTIIQIMNQTSKYSEKVGQKVTLTVGMNFGGPIAAGIMNIKRPQLQVIGDVFDLTNQMKATAKPETIQITRRLYELIYCHGFEIIERGEIQVSNNRRVDVYIVKY